MKTVNLFRSLDSNFMARSRGHLGYAAAMRRTVRDTTGAERSRKSVQLGCYTNNLASWCTAPPCSRHRTGAKSCLGGCPAEVLYFDLSDWKEVIGKERQEGSSC